MEIFSLITNKNYIAVDKDMIKSVGLDGAILLGELENEYVYSEKQNTLKDGYFCTTVKDIQENTTLTDYQQRTILKRLQEMKLIDVKLMGIPARRFIRINKEYI